MVYLAAAILLGRQQLALAILMHDAAHKRLYRNPTTNDLLGQWLTGHGRLYVGLWLLPMMTVLQVLLRIRSIAEHAGYSPGRDRRYAARTVVSPSQTWWFAPHKVAYHIEHHVYPSGPFHRLPELHRRMDERAELPQANVFTGYGAVLRSVLR